MLCHPYGLAEHSLIPRMSNAFPRKPRIEMLLRSATGPYGLRATLSHRSVGSIGWRPPRSLLPLGPELALVGQDLMKSNRSALIVSACVVGMPCGNPAYVFNAPFCRSFADSGPESA